MNKVIISEWKCLYPIKKGSLLVLEIFLLITSFLGLARVNEYDSLQDYIIWLVFVGSTIILFPRIIRYVKVPYRCIPCLSQIIDKKELLKKIDSEEFYKIQNLEGTIWEKKIRISENWFCIKNHYIPKNGIVEIWSNYSGNFFTDRHCHLGFLFVTGEIFNIEVAILQGYSMRKDYGKFLIRTEVALDQTLQDNTLGIGIKYNNTESKKEFIEQEFGSSIKILKEKLPILIKEDKLIDIVTKENDVQKKLVQEIKEGITKDKDYQDKVWTERWKTIPYYKEYIDEKWLDSTKKIKKRRR